MTSICVPLKQKKEHQLTCATIVLSYFLDFFFFTAEAMVLLDNSHLPMQDLHQHQQGMSMSRTPAKKPQAHNHFIFCSGFFLQRRKWSSSAIHTSQCRSPNNRVCHSFEFQLEKNTKLIRTPIASSSFLETLFFFLYSGGYGPLGQSATPSYGPPTTGYAIH
jgi:hypothetical protein